MFYNWAVKQKHKEEKKLIFWWQSKKDPRPNIGDYVAYDLVNRIIAMKGKQITDKKDHSNKLVSVGSVLHFANTGDTIWGTGLNKKMADKVNRFKKLDVRAVRGPLTRDYLMKRDIEVPQIYGDPAILLPYFYPKKLMEQPQKKDFIIINHMNDDMAKYAGHEEHLVTPMQYPGSFIESIVNSKLVISSSLHGVIIAEAYGVPAIFFDSGSGEAMFKYEDYYQGTGRRDIPKVTTIEEALSREIVSPPDFTPIAKKLYNAFPFDLWM
ncbi:polysaccharide pyruvyl transferase family protein [Alteromonas pelagimontana]|uniref:Polysaccharide pyruvyl transferase family protein n=1 Tax=Alteromonas pelagimontana TaxID=1858656 RepID=A0A6M4MAY2_9ALTE|nr:polysaccharide pyruvyl transferase family protein [Alteromonas pelagimontana]QJR80187.1 polysaccharide pyruvyl transferase family protein [Alteromonas pelagimontana]